MIRSGDSITMMEKWNIEKHMEENVETKDIRDMLHDGKIYEHHTSWARGYLSRKTDGYIEAYSGKFGKGFKAHKPSFTTTQFHTVTYYIYQS